ncbi:MAG: type II and III secretion system protein family protein, partial [Xanthobacteraceae bacterium]|nr:type II and III secretion system protein family protein [Xanthobacteraceae bacterium]
PGDVIKTPLDQTLPPNDVDLFLMGKTDVPRSTARLLEGVPPHVYAGHVLDLPKGGARVVSVRN